jgi:hypothetical protein
MFSWIILDQKYITAKRTKMRNKKRSQNCLIVFLEGSNCYSSNAIHWLHWATSVSKMNQYLKRQIFVKLANYIKCVIWLAEVILWRVWLLWRRWTIDYVKKLEYFGFKRPYYVTRNFSSQGVYRNAWIKIYIRSLDIIFEQINLKLIPSQ